VLRKLKLRLRALYRRQAIADEIELHIDRLTEEFAAQGLTPREARLAATRQFGSPARIQEQSRELFSFGLLEDLLRDIAHAGRVFRRTPLFYAGAAFILALGIGANCAVFNLVHAVLLKPLPYERPAEVVMLLEARTSRRLRELRARSAGLFSDLAVMKMWDGNPDAWFDLVLPDHAERLRAGLVTPNFFSVLGVHAALGRVFSPHDQTAGYDNLIVLSHGLWLRAYGGDPAIVGRHVIFLTGLRKGRLPRTYTVIGVLPPGFRFTYPLETEVWAMCPWNKVENVSQDNWIQFNGAVARLAPGVSFEAAKARISDPKADSNRDARFPAIQSVTDWVAGKARPSILLVAAVSLLLLFIACATVANALLVRMAERKRELAVRASLGAGRGRLIRQLLTEGLALSLAGTAGGVLLGAALLPVFRSLVPLALNRADEMAVEPGLLLIPAAAATLVTLLSLVAPILHGSRVEVAQVLKGSSGSPSATRWRFAFVALQANVATWLLVGAALLLISFWRLGHVDLGFDGNRVVTAEMRLLDPKYFDDRAAARFQQEVIERVRALPGVREAGIASAVPFRGVDWLGPYKRVGYEKSYMANHREVDPEYFSVMRLVLLRGRLLTDRDTVSSEPVVVITESVARQVFPGEEPIGKQLDFHGPRTIVGVVKDIRYKGLDQPPFPAIYRSAAQSPSELVCLVLRTAVDGERMGAELRSVVHQVDPAVPVMDVTTVSQIVWGSVADRRFYTAVISAFAALAILLTATGLVVVIARSVAERRRELAIRCALGAQSRELIGLVIRQGLTPVVLGAAIGLAGAWAGARILERFLFGVTLHNPAVYAGAGVFTVTIAALACFLPARQAGKLPPAAALQSE
jgi:putative ABC transport system permease protein